MRAPPKPLFVKRPRSRGYGYDANGAAGWRVVIAVWLMTMATGIPAGLLLRGSDWPLGIPLLLVILAQALGLVWFAKRESERDDAAR